jgi:5-methylcytosine-specific restriction endonuclease McrA
MGRVVSEAAKERNRERARKWRAENAERAREAVRAYREAHREEARAATRAWVAANRERFNARCQERYYRLKNAPINDLTDEQWQAILREYGHRCAYCGRSDARIGQDHVIPIARGGAHTASNVVPACFPCNQRKALNDAPLPPPPTWERVRAASTRRR